MLLHYQCNLHFYCLSTCSFIWNYLTNEVHHVSLLGHFYYRCIIIKIFFEVYISIHPFSISILRLVSSGYQDCKMYADCELYLWLRSCSMWSTELHRRVFKNVHTKVLCPELQSVQNFVTTVMTMVMKY